MTELTVGAWHEAIGHLDYDLCREAIRNIRSTRDSGEWVDTSDIIGHAKIVQRRRDRDKRIEGGIPQSPDGAPKPDNFDAMADAYDSGDPIRIAHEVATYERQLADVGYSDEWTKSGRVDHRLPRAAY